MDKRTIDRLRRALQRVRGIPVKVISRSEWVSALRPGGQPTELLAPLSPFVTGLSDVPIVEIAASAFPAVATPGYHHVRVDLADAPNIFNTDSHHAIEDLAAEKDFHAVCRFAGLRSQSINSSQLREYVFLVGPIRRGDHHSAHVPADIVKAKKK